MIRNRKDWIKFCKGKTLDQIFNELRAEGRKSEDESLFENFRSAVPNPINNPFKITKYMEESEKNKFWNGDD
jgi:hypothetical protein